MPVTRDTVSSGRIPLPALRINAGRRDWACRFTVCRIRRWEHLIDIFQAGWISKGAVKALLRNRSLLFATHKDKAVRDEHSI